MPRQARVVAAGVPHHIMQRGALVAKFGNDRFDQELTPQKVFTSEVLRRAYLQLLKEHATEHKLHILAYCLMSSHAHVVAIPENENSLALTFRAAHTRFAQFWNAEMGGSGGRLWQNRFYSCPVETSLAPEVIAYVENNPVRAGLVRKAADYTWSSARAHMDLHTNRELMDQGLHQELLDMAWWRERFQPDQWVAELSAKELEDWKAIRSATFGGRPLGSPQFVAGLEVHVGRRLTLGKSGRPRKNVKSEGQPELQQAASV